MFNLRKILIRIFKKHQKLTTFLLPIILAMLIEAAYEYGKEDLLIIRKNSESIKENKIRIITLEGKVKANTGALNEGIVSRQSFNSYIARKDNEYHRQQDFNRKSSNEISILNGKMIILDEFINNDMRKRNGN